MGASVVLRIILCLRFGSMGVWVGSVQFIASAHIQTLH